jgi:dTDP-4-dehydrorhamnose reductase
LRTMKIAVIGADGQLGSDLVKSLEDRTACIPLYYPDFDLTKPAGVRSLLSKLDCDIVINTAAFNRVDDSEDSPEEAFRLNAFAVRNLSLICERLNMFLVHYSTDYVFGGEKERPYTEEDCPAPLSVYGMSKLAGDLFLKSSLDRFLIIRTSGLFGAAGCWGKGRNFVDIMVGLENSREPVRVVEDQIISPTHSLELAEKTLDLLNRKASGIVHLTNEGQCSWFEFAQRIFELRGSRPRLVPVTSVEFGAKARRPAYSVLENARAKSMGIPEMSPWEKALEDYMKIKEYIS